MSSSPLHTDTIDCVSFYLSVAILPLRTTSSLACGDVGKSSSYYWAHELPLMRSKRGILTGCWLTQQEIGCIALPECLSNADLFSGSVSDSCVCCVSLTI